MSNNPVSPVKVYLSQIGKESARISIYGLNYCVSIMSDSECKDALEFDWSKVSYQDTAKVRADIVNKYAPATCHRTLSSLRSVLEQCWLLGLMDADTYQRAIRLAPIIGTSLPAGRMLEKSELHALIDDCAFDTSIKGVRDLALISVMYSMGLRRAEATNLLYENYSRSDSSFIIDGKRNKKARGYLLEDAVIALERWIEIRGEEKGVVFYHVDFWDNIFRHKLSPHAIYYILKKRAERAGIKTFSPHDLRRTFISDLLVAKVDVFTVAKMARHTNIATTARYDRRNEENTKLDAMKVLSL